MPAEHWVAFDAGTDKVHDCRKEAAAHIQQGKRKDHLGIISKVRSPAREEPSSLRTWTLKSAGYRQNTEPLTTPSLAVPSKCIRVLIDQAIRDHSCVKMTYYTAYRNAITERVVEPLLVKSRERGGPILFAYCRWRQEIRSFALSNILQAELLKETFVPRRILPPKLSTKYRHYAPSRVSSLANSWAKRSDTRTNNWVLWLVLAGIAFLWLVAVYLSW